MIAEPVVKTLGAATWNGLTLESFQYKFTSNGECILHPYLFQDLSPPGPPAPNNVPGPNKLGFICGNVNETFMSVLLPFSSFGAASAPVAVNVPVTLASPGSGFIRANGGFNQGAATVFDSIADPPIVGGGGTQSSSAWMGQAPIRSAMMIVDFANDYDDVVGFGQVNNFNYSLKFAVADGVTLSDGSANLALANSIAFGGLYLVDPLDGVTKTICVPTTQTAAPPGCVPYTSVCGGCIRSIATPTPCYPANCTGGAGVNGGGNVVVLFNNITKPFEVKITAVPVGFNSTGGPFDELANSNTVDATSSVSIGGTTSSGSGGAGSVSQTVSLSRSSSTARFQIWLGKSSGVLVGGTQPIPGAAMQFTLEVQVSQNHSYKALVAVDYIRDGLDWNSTVGTPSLVLAGRAIPIDVARFVTINRTLIGNDGSASDGTDGTTIVTFNVSGIILADNSSALAVVGRTKLSIVYFTTIRTTYTDHTSPSGDRNVVPGDCLTNNAELYADQTQLTNTSVVLTRPVRTAASQVGVPQGQFNSALHAVNGQLCSLPANAALCSQVEYEPLTQFTISVTYQMITDAYRLLSVSEAYPIPLFDISTLTWPSISAGVVNVNASANQCSSSSLPALGFMCFASTNRLTSRNPTFSVNPSSMRWQLAYGTAAYTAASSTISVLVTVNMTGIPWIDGFDVVSLEDRTENAASSCANLLTDYQLIRTRTPKLCITEGAVVRQPNMLSTLVSYDSRFTTLSTTGSPFTGVVTQRGTGGLSLTPVGSVAPTGVQAGDRIRMAVLVVNSGRGTAVQVLVQLPQSQTYFADPQNVRVFTGANVAVTTATYAGGVVTVPSLAGATTRGGTDDTGNNVLVIVYDVTVRDVFQPVESATPLASQLNVTLTQYRAGMSTVNYATTLHASGQYSSACLRSNVAVSGRRPTVVNDFVSGDLCTSDASATPDIAVGEPFRLRTNVTLPYGTLAGASFALSVASVGAQFSVLNASLSTQPASSSNGITTGPIAGAPSTLASPLNVAFGTLTLPATATGSQVTVDTWLRSSNSTTVSNGLTVVFTSSITYTNPFVSPANNIVVSTSPRVIMRRQQMNVVGFTNFSSANPFQQYDLVRYCFNMTRAITTACAYNVSVSIPIPSQMVLYPNSASLVYPNGSVVAGATVSSTASPVTANIPLVDRVVPTPLMLCYTALYLTSVTGVTVTTTATVCTDTTPDEPSGAITCRTATADVSPRLASSITSATSDACTSNSNLIAHVGELITFTNTVSLPRGTTAAVSVDVQWSVAADLLVVSQRVVSFGACISPQAGNTAPVVTSSGVTWSFGTLTRNVNLFTTEPSGCGAIVVEVVTRVADVAQNSVGADITITGRIAGGSPQTSSTSTQIYTIVGPTLTAASTLVPTTGDAGDTAQYCFTLSNSNTAVATAACAYDVNVNVPIPSGYTGTPTTFSFARIAPGETTAQQCVALTLTTTVATSRCNPITATAVYSADDDTRATAQTVTTTQTHCVSSPTISATLTATNDSCTGSSAGSSTSLPDVQVGELVTYVIVVRVPEGVASVLTPQIAFDSRTALVVGTPAVTSVGSRLNASLTPSVTALASSVSWAFGTVLNTFDNVAGSTDDITLTVQVRVLSTATVGAVLTPTVTLVHAGSTLTAASAGTQAEVIEPTLTRASSVTPTTGAYGDSVKFSFTVQHSASSSRCAYNVEVCETPSSLEYQEGTVVISGITPAPTVTETANGFCFTIPSYQTGAVSVSYNATLLDLPAGVDRCAAGTATYTSAPAQGFAPRTATSQACVRQVLLETIGDLLWIDTNGDGRQDNVGATGGETPIAGAVVRLYDQTTRALIATTATSAAGVYLFDRRQHGILPNTLYTIETDTRPGLHVTLVDQTTESLDSDAAVSGAVVSIRSASVAPASHNLAFDFGFAAPITIGDFVWRDLNSNGIQDDGASAPLAGVVVQLLQNGAVIATTATSATGLYQFSSLTTSALTPGRDYGIVVALDSQPVLATTVGGRSTFLIPTSTGRGTTLTDNNAVLNSTANTAAFTFTLPNRWNQNELSLDIGLVPPPPLGFTIGDYVFDDRNSNGVQDAGDVPLAGVVVELRDAGGALVASTTTSAAGAYQFASLGGSFTMTSLTAYTVQLPANQAVLAGRYVTLRDQGADDAVDSDSVRNNATGVVSIALVSPVDGRNNMTLDFGFRSVALGGDVWRDGDGDGNQDEAAPVGSVVVTLYDSTGATPLATTLSKSDGTYLFSSDVVPALVPGTTYTVGIALPTDFQPTLPDNVAGNDAVDSDGRLRSGSTTDVRSGPVMAPLTGSDTTTDFGVVQRFTIGNYVWLDVSGEGRQDAGERALGGVSVALLEGSVEIARTTTDANGLYTFSSLLPGKALPQSTGGYAIEIGLAQASLATYVPTAADLAAAAPLSDSDGVLDAARGVSRALVTTPVYGAVDNQHDFGFRDLRVGNRVWVDQNADGVQSSGEAGIAGVVVQLLAANGTVLASTATAADGSYMFTAADGVAQGAQYVIRVAYADATLAGRVLSLADAGANDALDSDARNSTDNAFAQVSLTAGAWGSANFDVADFGFQPLLEIGDFVWRDTNGNGRQDAGEPGIANVAVSLTRSDTASPFSAQTFTDANGFYYFSRRDWPALLPATQYAAFVALGQVVLNGLQPTLDASSVPGVPAADSDGVWNRVGGTSQASAVLTPAFGGRIPTYDFGFVQQLSVGGDLWEDRNGDGINDASEPRLGGVTVALYSTTGTLIGTTTTLADGSYLFRSHQTAETLPPNTSFEIRVVLPQAPLTGEYGTLEPTLPNVAAGGDTSDSDATFDSANGVAVIVGVRSGAYGSTNTTNDIGFVGPVVIGDYVWHDSNANGAQDSGESGLVGVTVDLLRNGMSVARTTTNATGFYLFDQRNAPLLVPTSDYVVRIDRAAQAPGGAIATMHLTTSNAAADAVDSDASKTSNTLYDVAVRTGALGSANKTLDFGFVNQILLNGTLWIDRDANGAQNEASANPLAGVVLELRNSAGAVLATTASAADGTYSFSSVTIDTLVPNAMYTVTASRVQAPLAALHETATNQGSDALDSDFARTLDQLSVAVSVGAYGAQAAYDNDAGFVQPVRIGNLVWRDVDGDGLQDAGEPGIGNVVVRLVLVSSNATVATVATDAAGLYIFDSKQHGVLPRTAYRIEVDALQAPLMFTRFTVTKPLQPSPTAVGTNSSIDSNGVRVPISGRTDTGHSVASVTSPAFFAEDLTFDFGWYEVAFAEVVVGDLVWLDTNADGVQQAGERGLAGVVVQLLDASGTTVLATVATDAAGLYSFDPMRHNLQPVTMYTIRIDTTQAALRGTAPTVAGSGSSSNATDSNGVANSARTSVSYALMTPPEGPNFSIDFGFVETRIGDRVWLDANDNGVQDADETTAFAGATVQLYQGSTLVASTLTDSSGLWQLTSTGNGIVPGTAYEVRYPIAGPLADYEPARRDQGASDAADSDAALEPVAKQYARTAVVAPAFGTTDQTIDAGFVRRFSLGDRVWLDLNGDGVQNTGEPGIGSVQLVLYDGATELARTTTLANGTYLFESLRNGLAPNTNYVIKIDGTQSALAPLRETSPLAAEAPDAGADSNIARDTTMTLGYTMNVLTPARGGSTLTYDAGFVQPFGVGDLVWRDTNANGVQDAGEPGIGNVPVTLYRDEARTMVLATTRTNSSGYYYFNSWESNLAPLTTYTIGMSLADAALAGLQPTDANVGGNGTRDSSGVLLAPASMVVLDSAVMTGTYGVSDTTYDYGFVPRLTFGDRVWLDADGDGVQDGAEAGIANVTVVLYTTGGAVHATTTTNAQGVYEFDSLLHSLRPGEQYVVSVSDQQPSIVGLQVTPTAQGGNTEADSNGARNGARNASEAAVTIASWGSAVKSVDFGFRPDFEIGNYVWRDANGNGVQDASGGETPLVGVVVELRANASTSEVLATTLTDAAGLYVFDSLTFPVMQPLTNYAVVINVTQEAFAGLRPTVPRAAAATAATNSDGVLNSTSLSVSLAARTPFFGATDYTFDAGFVPEITLGDLVWHDVNGDGVYDASTETPLANITVTLTRRSSEGVEVRVTTTDANGNYKFDTDLLSFTRYELSVSLAELPGYEPTPESALVVRGTDVVLTKTTGEYGSSDLTLDFPFVKQFNIGDRVFIDVDQDGAQSAPDVSVPGVRVQLLNSTGGVVATSITDAAGLYNFNSFRDDLVRVSPYTLVVALDQMVTLPTTGSGLLSALYQPTATAAATASATTDSNGALNTARTASVAAVTTPEFGVDDRSFDFGFVRQFSFGDYVWLDTDGDGVQDGTEAGIAGVLIELLDAEGTGVLATTLTAAGGAYRFNSFVDRLDAYVEYQLRIEQQQAALTGRVATAPLAGGDAARDSNGVPSVDARYSVATVAPLRFNDSVQTYDFGFLNALDIGDYLWIDRDGDGAQEASELPLVGVEVQLRDASNAVIASTLTNATGQYVFTSAKDGLLPRTNYTISVALSQAPLEALQPTVALAAAGNVRNDSNGVVVASSTSQASALTPAYGQSDFTFDFGFRPRIYVGDRVWHDVDNDGVQSPSELGIANVTVQLVGADGVVLSATTTDAAGFYQFDSFTSPIVPGGTYTLSVPLAQTPLAAVEPTVPNAAAAIEDTDSDGVLVRARGTSEAVFVAGNWGANQSFVGDFGMASQFNIGDRVWLDMSPTDGVQSDAERGIAGVQVQLLDAMTRAVVATTTTDADGLWRFNSLRDALTPLRAYELSIPIAQAALAGLQPTHADLGANDTLDSDAVLDAAQSAASWPVTTPAWGSDDLTLDAGFVQRFTIGDLIWRDANGDGQQQVGGAEAEERGIAGVLVQLYDAANGSVIATTRSNNLGVYTFDSMVHVLEPGAAYVVVVDRTQSPLDGLQQAVANAAAAGDDSDSDGRWRSTESAVAPVLATAGAERAIVAPVTAPAYGVSDLSTDFGFVGRLDIGGLVWKDVGRDGAQSVGDGGVGNVTVRLLAANGSELARTETSADGRYLFESYALASLVEQTAYSLVVEWAQPPLTVTTGFWSGSTLMATIANAPGVNDTLDSDGVASVAAMPMRNVSTIGVVTGAWGTSNRTLDFGFQDPPLVGSEIGNFLWIDSNADGVQNMGELPLANVTIALIDQDTRAVIASTVSSAAGQYKFNTLDDGFESESRVLVSIALGQPALSGLTPTAPTVAGSEPASDSNGVVNATSGAVEAHFTTPGDGYSDFTIDFGFLRIELGDYVWFDSDNAGDQDESEAPRAGVVVRLETAAGALVAQTLTDSAGRYLFTSNAHGVRATTDYVVVVNRTQEALLGFNATRANAAGVDDALDSDGVPLAGGERVGIAVRTGALGTRNYSLDFGFFHLLELGDYVFNDRNGDGLQNAGDTPLAGVVVELRGADGTVVATTATNAAGQYLFTHVEHGLVPDTAYVVALAAAQAPLVGLTPTWSPAAADGALDSNGAMSNGTVLAHVTTGPFGSVDRTVDFGFVGEVAIGDFVWHDTNGNGLYDTTAEVPIANVTLQLHNPDGTVLATTLTDEVGAYRFDNDRIPLRPSTAYTVVMPTVPAGLQLTLPNVGANNGVDSDAVYASGVVTMPTPTGAVGSANLTFDIGLTPQSFLGDRVWLDLNGDGVQNGNETGIAGVTVRLLDAGGAIVASTVTNAAGEYVFNSLADRFLAQTPYTVVLPAQPALSAYLPTVADAGDDRSADSSGVQSGDAVIKALITGPPGTDDRSVDFGFVELFGIGDLVFVDDNRNGVQDSNERGLAGVVVGLFERGAASGAAPLATTATNSGGVYVFSSRSLSDTFKASTDYEVRMSMAQAPLALYVLTAANSGADDAADSDAVLRGTTAVIATARSPAFGDVDMSFDFGLVLETRLGNLVWDDRNGDGVQTAGEPGIGGVRVDLFNSTGARVGSTLTGADGSYLFTSADQLVPGQAFTLRITYNNGSLAGYSPTIINATASAALNSDGRVDYATRTVEHQFVAPLFGTDDLTLDFGFVKQLEIGDLVWLDTNANGRKDDGEDGIAGVVITLKNKFGTVLGTTRTDSTGDYRFLSTEYELLPQTAYIASINLTQAPLASLRPTTPLVGTSRGVDSDGVYFEMLNLSSAEIMTPAVGGADTSFDFGFVLPIVVGDRVWRDTDHDGVQDAGERGIAGVVVQLVSVATAQVVATTTSNADGLYAFSSTNTSFGVGQWQLRIETTQPALNELHASPTHAANASAATDSNGAPLSAAADAPVIADVAVTSYAAFGTNTTFDFGFAPRCVVLSGAIFIDADQDGLRDANELPARSARVELVRASTPSVVEHSTLTDATGAWRLGEFGADLLPDTDYFVRIDSAQSAFIGLQVPEAYRDPATGEWRVPVRTPACGEGAQTVSAVGLLPRPQLRLGDYVFLDRNGNGAQDAGDRPLAGIEVCLFRGDTLARVSCVTTGADGAYVFVGDGLAADGVLRQTNYVVAINLTQPAVADNALYPTFANEEGVSDGVDSDGTTRTIGGVAMASVLVSVGDFGYVNTTLDFGLYDCEDTDVRGGLPEARVTFTGDAKRDFESSNGAWTYFRDSTWNGAETPDVGLPRSIYPESQISGWDMRGIYFAYSPSADLLFIGIDCFGICGDADGNGDPATIIQPYALDLPNLSDSETFAIMMDTNNDGQFDLIAGVPATYGCNTIECIGAYLYDGNGGVSPGMRFSGQRLNFTVALHCNPSQACPDIEFTLDRWSTAPKLRTKPFQWSFGFEAFAGSFLDGGIGEDFMGTGKPLQARFICPATADSGNFNPLPPVVGSCCQVQTYSGCATRSVQDCVCQRRPSCCTTLWDASCVAAVDTLNCGGSNREFSCLPPPTTSNATACCAGRQSGGCGNAPIEQCVCAADPFCCSSRWDTACAQKVRDLRCSTVCGAYAPTPAPSPAPTPAPTGSVCARCLASGFGSPGSSAWCECCAQNCGGYQRNCIADNQFCLTPFRCQGSSYCQGVVVTPPTPVPPTPVPTFTTGAPTPAPPATGSSTTSGGGTGGSTSIATTLTNGGSSTTAPGGSTTTATGDGGSTTALPPGSESVVLSSSAETVVRVYSTTNSSDLVGLVYFPPGPITYSDGMSTFVVKAVHAPGATGAGIGSGVVDIELPLLLRPGMLFATTQKPTRVCLVPRPGLLDAGDGITSYCLASRVDASSAWACDDNVLLATRDGNFVAYCGYARHFTQFALSSRNLDRGMAIEEPDEPFFDSVPLWVLILLPVLLCCLLLLICICLIVRWRRNKKEVKAKESQAQQWQPSPQAPPEVDEDVVLIRERRRRSSVAKPTRDAPQAGGRRRSTPGDEIDAVVAAALRSGGNQGYASHQLPPPPTPSSGGRRRSSVERRRSSSEGRRGSSDERRVSVLDEAAYRALVQGRREERRTSVLDAQVYDTLRNKQNMRGGNSVIDAAVYRELTRSGKR
jgi:hypothetical protein